MTDHATSAGTVFAVATGKGGVGKTTATVELAMALARQGTEVVVVDCDIDMSGLDGRLSLSAETTLHDVLAGDAAVEDAIVEAGGFRAVLGNPRLDRFAETDPNPGELRRVVEELRTQFDVVLLDTSSNARTAAAPLEAADHAILVTTPDRPALAATRRTAALAEQYDTEVAGVVVPWTDHAAVDGLGEVPAELECSPDVVVRAPDERGGGRGISAEVAIGYQELAEQLPEVGETGSDETETADAEEMFGDGATEESSETGPGEGYVRRSGRLSALGDLLGGPRRAGEPAPIAYDSERGLTASRRGVVAAAIAMQIVLVGLVVGDPPIPLVRPIVGGAYGMFLPGLLVALLLDLDRCTFTRLLVYSVGLSAVVLLAVGAVVSLAYPTIGLENPFREGTVVATLTVVVFGLSAASLARNQTRRVRVPIQGAFSPLPLALLLVPFVSIFGITFQNITGNSAMLLGMLVALSVLPLANASDAVSSRWLSLAVWVTAAALLYHNSLFGPSIGGPSGSAATLESGVWEPSDESVLPNGVLFPTYVLLTGMPLGIEVSTLNPLLVSFLPVILFEGYREQVGDRAGFASACLFMFSFPFYVLYPSAGRVATPVFFLALVGLVVSDPDVSRLRKRLLAMVFGMGLAVSHYGTAYVGMVAFAVALVTYAAFDVIDTLRSPVLNREWRAMLDFDAIASSVRERRPDFLSLPLVLFYGVFVVEWYFYTSGGNKFAILPRKILSVVNRFFEASATGTAAGAVSKDYGSASIAMSRRLYIVVGALMGAGIAATALARIVREDGVDVDDEFLALGVGFMSMLGTSFFVVGFNVARIMMIVFTFTAIYIVPGAGSIVEGVLMVRRAVERALESDYRGSVRRLVTVNFDRALKTARVETSAVSVLLCVFLLLNSGVVTVFVTHDYAPSNIVTQQQLEKSEEVQVQLKAKGCVKCDIASHVWLFNHRNRSNYAYGDFMAWAQVDFYRGPIAAELSYFPKKTTYRDTWDATNGTEGQALILLLDHNTDTGVMLIESKYYWKNLTYLSPVLSPSHRVYSTGETVIYRSSDRATEEYLDFERPVPTNVTNASTMRALANGTARSDPAEGRNATDGGENATDDERNTTGDGETEGVNHITDAENATTTDAARRTPPPEPDASPPTMEAGSVAEVVAERDDLGRPGK
jgi:septum site-determining protein MinD